MENENSDLQKLSTKFQPWILALIKLVQNRKGKVLLLVGIAVLLMSVGATGYYLGIKKGRSALTQSEKQSVPVVATSVIKTPVATFVPSPTATPIPGTSYFISRELNVSFEYPSALGKVTEGPASNWALGDKGPEGEEWWKIEFEDRGDYYPNSRLSASTPNYMPDNWEGTPQWFNAKISEIDDGNSVKQKLESRVNTGRIPVVKVEKIQSSKGLVAFRVWALSCYQVCAISRVYLIPLSKSKYESLVVYTDTRLVVEDDLSKGEDKIRIAALSRVSGIENNQMDDQVKRYLEWQDLIFNSLTFSN